MTMRPAVRKLALTAHVSSSVGWLGAVATSLALAIAGLVSEDALTVRGAYVTLELVGRYVLIPLSAASLLTGLISSLGTSWGLFRYYWVVAKLMINLFAGVVLLMYMESLDFLARLAADASSSEDVARVGSSSPVLHAAGALLLLVIATVLALYKPRGVTRYGWRKQGERRAVVAPQS